MTRCSTCFFLSLRTCVIWSCDKKNIWSIKFDGEEYGPYKTEREAILFAIDAANKFGEQGEKTQVLQMEENGEAQVVWTYGHDPYPPKQ